MRLLIRGIALGSTTFLVLGLIAAPALLGSTRGWSWPLTVLVFAACALFTGLRFVLGREQARAPLLAPTLLALLVALGALQAIPLPRSIVESIAPERARQDAAALAGLAQPSAMLAISVSPDLTWAWTWKWAAGAVALTAVALLLRRRRHARALLFLIAALAALEAIGGTAAAVAGIRHPDQGPGRAAGSFVNANHFAGFCELGLFVALGLLFDRVRRVRVPDYARLSARISAIADSPDFWRVGLLAGLVAAIGVGLVASVSRGALFASAAGFTIFALLFARDRARWLIVPALLFIIAVGWWAGGEALRGRLDRMFDTGFGRSEFLVMSMKIFAANPVTGAGLGAFLHSQAPHWPSDEAASYALYAHNDYADTVAGGGLLGGVLLLGFLAALGWTAWKRATRGASPLWMGAVSAVAALCVHAWVEFNWQIPGVATAFFALAGVILCPAFRVRGEGGDARPAGLAMIAFAAVAMVIVPRAAVDGWHPTPDLVAQARAKRIFGGDPTPLVAAALAREPMPGDAHIERAWYAVSKGDFALADECFDRAIDRDPGNLRVLAAARDYGLTRLDPARPDPAVLARLERVAGPVVWNSRDPYRELDDLLRATQSIDFVTRLVPPERNPTHLRWLDEMKRYRESRIK